MNQLHTTPARITSSLVGLTVVMILAFSLSVHVTPARAREPWREAAPALSLSEGSSRRPALRASGSQAHVAHPASTGKRDRGHEAVARPGGRLGEPATIAHVAPTRERTHPARTSRLSFQGATWRQDNPLAAPLCGAGAPPDYGFTYDLQQPHWTVGWENHVSEQAVTEVDTVLDRLNADSIAQTMILFLPQDQVGIRVNCAVHFLRYMKLGLPTGERADNGFVFLIVVEPASIDVHYGVGLGLPALTAPYLTDLNRLAADTYQSTHSMDQALLTLVRGFDTLARSKYAPLISPTPTPAPVNSAQLPSNPLGILTICGQMCFGLLVILFLLWLASKGIIFIPSGSGSGGFGGFSSGGDGGGSSMRGGSGSGRSGRGN